MLCNRPKLDVGDCEKTIVHAFEMPKYVYMNRVTFYAVLIAGSIALVPNANGHTKIQNTFELPFTNITVDSSANENNNVWRLCSWNFSIEINSFFIVLNGNQIFFWKI